MDRVGERIDRDENQRRRGEHNAERGQRPNANATKFPAPQPRRQHSRDKRTHGQESGHDDAGMGEVPPEEREMDHIRRGLHEDHGQRHGERRHVERRVLVAKSQKA